MFLCLYYLRLRLDWHVLALGAAPSRSSYVPSACITCDCDPHYHPSYLSRLRVNLHQCNSRLNATLISCSCFVPFLRMCMALTSLLLFGVLLRLCIFMNLSVTALSPIVQQSSIGHHTKSKTAHKISRDYLSSSGIGANVALRFKTSTGSAGWCSTF